MTFYLQLNENVNHCWAEKLPYDHTADLKSAMSATATFHSTVKGEPDTRPASMYIHITA